MSEPDDPNFHRLIDLATAAYAHELENDVTSHPATEALVAYQEGRLEPSDAEEVRRHLVACPLCSEALERLDAYDQGSDQGWSPETEAAARSWARFREHSTIDAKRPATLRSEGTRRSSLRWPAWVLAASILFALVGAFTLFQALQPTMHSTGVPATSGNPYVFDLVPDGRDAHRSNSGIETIQIPTGMDMMVPRLLIGDQTAYSSYSAILTGVSGETVWKQSGLRRQPSGEIVLLIQRAGIPAGDYVLRLLNEGPGGARELARYTFRLHYLE